MTTPALRRERALRGPQRALAGGAPRETGAEPPPPAAAASAHQRAPPRCRRRGASAARECRPSCRLTPGPAAPGGGQLQRRGAAAGPLFP